MHTDENLNSLDVEKVEKVKSLDRCTIWRLKEAEDGREAEHDCRFEKLSPHVLCTVLQFG